MQDCWNVGVFPGVVQIKLNEQKNLKELDHLRHLSSYLGARKALTLGGTMLGYYPVKILPSKTLIAPVNPTFLP
ncbi:hypothetical protein L1987_86059 [Smallanthus sonchifolius]|uniref:Uncharacterized protein n=1 Tax=Smallanthus sonchifolius TaxID=185202 RepID=A0ACB8XZH1_9ASTR|nr:hypothetical protein L1987_86059 [Smallanthus sonchifolius]